MAVVTWNPSDKGAGITLSNGDLDLVSNGAFYSVRATLSRSTGKFYYEQTIVTASTSNLMLGWMSGAASLATYIGNSAIGAAVNSTTTTTYNNGFTVVNNYSLAAPVQGDVVMFAIDYDAGKAWVGKNGTWSASGDPAAGTNPWVTFTANTALFPAGCSFDASHKLRGNFGASAFGTSPPSGFSAFQLTTTTMNTVAGAYALTGIAAFLGRLFIMGTVTGSYALTGIAAATRRTIRLLAAVGSYALTGIAARTGRGVRLAADIGAYAITGIAAQTRLTWRLLAAPGAYTITGIALALARAAVSASKFKLRRAAFVLQKLRQQPPTLGD